jgi:tRNA/rRNA methyltransferase
MEIYFILVKPVLPDNVGAAARALNTMGFKNLRLVNPCDHLSGQARCLAHGSQEILEKAEVFSSLEEALGDMDFSIATTARRRHLHVKNWIPIEALPKTLASKKSLIKRVAVVFGTEDHGLLNEEIEACDILTYIPMAKTYPSLNLGQAVMLYAYILSAFTVDKRLPSQGREPPPGFFPVFKRRLEDLFAALDIRKDSLFHKKIMKRIGLLSRTDLRLIHFFLDQLDGKS